MIVDSAIKRSSSILLQFLEGRNCVKLEKPSYRYSKDSPPAFAEIPAPLITTMFWLDFRSSITLAVVVKVGKVFLDV